MLSLQITFIAFVAHIAVSHQREIGGSCQSQEPSYPSERQGTGVLVAGLLDTALKNVLDSLDEDYYEDGTRICIWNDWRSRDQRARIERTFNRARFSYPKRFLGFVTGRWYCCLTTIGAREKGIPLD